MHKLFLSATVLEELCTSGIAAGWSSVPLQCFIGPGAKQDGLNKFVSNQAVSLFCR